MRHYKTEGIVIKRRNAKEADTVITVFTKYNGKISLKASGVRRIHSKRAPHVELLNRSVISFYKSTSGGLFLTEVATIQSFSQIKEDLKKIGYAYYICELIDSLCPENQENEFVYSLLVESLQKCSVQNNLSSIVDLFETTLLSHLGFYPKNYKSQFFNASLFIEDLLERRLKTKKLLPHFS